MEGDKRLDKSTRRRTRTVSLSGDIAVGSSEQAVSRRIGGSREMRYEVGLDATIWKCAVFIGAAEEDEESVRVCIVLDGVMVKILHHD